MEANYSVRLASYIPFYAVFSNPLIDKQHRLMIRLTKAKKTESVNRRRILYIYYIVYQSILKPVSNPTIISIQNARTRKNKSEIITYNTILVCISSIVSWYHPIYCIDNTWDQIHCVRRELYKSHHHSQYQFHHRL